MLTIGKIDLCRQRTICRVPTQKIALSAYSPKTDNLPTAGYMPTIKSWKYKLIMKQLIGASINSFNINLSAHSPQSILIIQYIYKYCIIKIEHISLRNFAKIRIKLPTTFNNWKWYNHRNSQQRSADVRRGQYISSSVEAMLL